MKTYLAPVTSIDSMILENCPILTGTGEQPAGYTGGGLPFGGAIQGNPSGDFFTSSSSTQGNEESAYYQYQWDNLSDEYMR